MESSTVWYITLTGSNSRISRCADTGRNLRNQRFRLIKQTCVAALRLPGQVLWNPQRTDQPASSYLACRKGPCSGSVHHYTLTAALFALTNKSKASASNGLLRKYPWPSSQFIDLSTSRCSLVSIQIGRASCRERVS